MSYGLPCIVSDITANREVQLSDARYFKPGDVAAISAKIMEFISKPFNDAAKTQQRELIAQKYNWDTIAEETLAVYKRVYLPKMNSKS
jgi:glycosyltransferase involved in cell wall biosynthesis